jgi:type IV pilus assembly protein PilY1
MRYLFLSIAVLFLTLLPVVRGFAQTMDNYTSYPPVMASSAKASALILLSNDSTAFSEGYKDPYNDGVDYYGYFDPRKSYDYQGGRFTPYQINASTTDHYAPSGYWSGNFLNWLTMANVDFLRKALTGGKRGIDAVSQTFLERGYIKTLDWTKESAEYQTVNISQVTPLSRKVNFVNRGTVFEVPSSRGRTDSYNVLVEVCNPGVSLEGNCTQFPGTGTYKPLGLLQSYRDKIDFGLMTYGEARVDSGGLIRQNIHDVGFEYQATNGQENHDRKGVILYINDYAEKGNDPLAEMYFDALRFYMGLTTMVETDPVTHARTGGATEDFCPVQGGAIEKMLAFGCSPNNNHWEDPIANWCQKNSIIILNDEYPSTDIESIPGSPFSDFTSGDFLTSSGSPIDVGARTKAVGDAEGITGTSRFVGNLLGGLQDDNCDTTKVIDDLSKVSGICPSEPANKGGFFLAGLTHYAMTEDLRPDMDGDQHLRTYIIAFRASNEDYIVPPAPMNPLWLASKYGNFDDQNGNKLPDLQAEWDKNKDGQPNGFYYADSGLSVEKALLEALEDVLARSASGTSVSVLATSGEGQGNLVQAYYRPIQTINDNDIYWTGYLQSLWVDEKGFIREDTNANHSLDTSSDKVVRYFVDTDGVTKVMRFAVSPEHPFPDVLNDPPTIITMDQVEVVWEAGARLASRSAGDRKIYTFLDLDNDQTVDASERVVFNQASASSIQPFLALQDATANAYLGATEADRATNLIEYIRGNDPTLNPSAFVDNTNLYLRDRVISGQTWKLGDIIHSTPVAISTPVDNYGAIYGDQTYQAFYNLYKDRETTVYVGANDGMLHAFTSWRYDSTAKSYIKPAVASSSEQLGDELWAYIPQNLLPHLKWLARPDYTHVFYMDLQPKVFDARIFPEDATHPHGWGTVLIAGMNTGGGDIFATGAFDGSTTETRYFRPSYAAIDVTDPRNPRLLWEKAFDGVNHTTSFPAVLRVKNSGDTSNVSSKGVWYATFGSGPATYDGTSTTNGRIYVVDLLTGNPYKSGTNDWLFQTAETKAFMGSPASIDMGLNYNVDAFYIGQTYDSSTNATPSWKGTLYKVRIPWNGTSSVYGSIIDGNTNNGSYNSDPSTWSLVRLFNSPRPITAAPALSLDQFQNTWIYFGTGRYFSLGLGGDKSSTETEYLYGIKDPFFNKQHQLDSPPDDYIFNDNYYHNPSSALTLAPADLFNADLYSVLDNGTVLTGDPGSYTVWGNFDLLKRTAREKNGWWRTLPTSTTAERSLTKPAVIGGVSLFTTFTPEGDICSFGGNSYLYALYYETGTAYERSIFKRVTQETDINGVTKNVYTGATDSVTVAGETQEKVVDKTDLGSGTTSSVGIHVGSQAGGEATGYVQQGTGNVIDFGFKPAFNIRSGIRSWRIAEPKIP